MNASHIIGRKKNRLNRCRKALTRKELTAERRNAISQRASDLEIELNKQK